MPFICYERKAFSEEKLNLLAQANKIINEYQKQGFNLTLRALYYKFVARDLFPSDWLWKQVANKKWVQDPNGTNNALPNYTRLSNLIGDGRMAGLVDWDAIIDQTRTSVARNHWATPSEILKDTHGSYAIDMWANQDHYLEVWVEKDALETVLDRACTPLDVRFFACRGYTSASAMWEASQRLLKKIEEGKQVHIIYLGDHDPSGIDMSRDIADRLSTFTYSKVHVHRIAMNMDQIKKYKPPPNWAKQTDSRFQSYMDKFGDQSWELDALDPPMLVSLITKTVLQYRNEAAWKSQEEVQRRGKLTLESIINHFPAVVGFLRTQRQQDDSPIVCQECGATAAMPKCACIDGPVKGILL